MNKIKFSTLITFIILILSYFTYNSYASSVINNTLQTNNDVYWAYGIKPLETSGINSQFKKDSYAGYTDYKSTFDNTYGYYDINKTENREGDNSLCFAVTASNALHWWFDINKDYIDKLFLDNPSYDSRLDEINNYRIKPLGHYDSNIYSMYHRRYFNRVGGYWPDILIDQFINGYYPKPAGGVNSESWDGKDLLEKGPDKLGGYFFNTFKEHKLTDRMYVNYNDLNKYLKTYINNKTLVMLTFVFGNSAHVVTIWGVEYDSNNNICAIYYTDSDDDKGIGMVRSKVVNRNGYAYITNKDDNAGGSRVDAISILKSGKEYFKPHTHEYGEPVWDLKDMNNVTATFTCKLDPTHIETIKATVTNHMIDSTCTNTGESYSLANVNFNNIKYVSNKFNIVTIPVKNHSFTDWITINFPTCSTTGLRKRHCITCNKIEEETIPALEHTLIHHNKLEPTCTSDGYESYDECSNCSYNTKVILPKLNHNYISEIIKPNCITDGYTIHTCNRCNDIYKDTIVNKLGHSLIHHNKLEPTCTSDGYESYDECSNCSYNTKVIIPKLNHNYISQVIKPTCTTDGYTIHTCSRCNDTYKDSIVSKLGHSFTEWKIIQNEACETSGLDKRICVNCSLEETKIRPQLSHNLLFIDGQKPTCTTDGFISHYTCSLCNKKLDLDKKTYLENIIINKLGHKPSDEWISENNHHYHICLNGCNKHLDIDSCSGGKATIITKPICDICNKEYGVFLENVLKYYLNIDKNIITSNSNNDIISIKLDEKELSLNDYKIENGSIVLNNDILSNLTNGKHIITVNFEDGHGILEIEIKYNKLILYITLPIISLSALSLIALVIRKKLI